MNNLKELRKVHGLTGVEVARRLDIPVNTYRRYESGERGMSVELIDKFSKFYKVTADAVLGLTNAELPKYNPQMHKIRVIGNIAAGTPILAEENTVGYTYADIDEGYDHIALKVCGNSMNAANIPDGSTVIVRLQPQVENGEIAAVRVDSDSATVKRVSREGSIIHLIPQSYDPEYTTQTYDTRTTNIDIIGKVVECTTKF